jgi:hypothetical protein
MSAAWFFGGLICIGFALIGLILVIALVTDNAEEEALRAIEQAAPKSDQPATRVHTTPARPPKPAKAEERNPAHEIATDQRKGSPQIDQQNPTGRKGNGRR